jgi:hypothetical protein
VHLVGFIIRIYHDARFCECQIIYICPFRYARPAPTHLGTLYNPSPWVIFLLNTSFHIPMPPSESLPSAGLLNPRGKIGGLGWLLVMQRAYTFAEGFQNHDHASWGHNRANITEHKCQYSSAKALFSVAFLCHEKWSVIWQCPISYRNCCISHHAPWHNKTYYFYKVVFLTAGNLNLFILQDNGMHTVKQTATSQ